MTSKQSWSFDLDLPDGSDYVSYPPKLTLEQYVDWCEEYWANPEKPRHSVHEKPVSFEEFVM